MCQLNLEISYAISSTFFSEWLEQESKKRRKNTDKWTDGAMPAECFNAGMQFLLLEIKYVIVCTIRCRVEICSEMNDEVNDNDVYL